MPKNAEMGNMTMTTPTQANFMWSGLFSHVLETIKKGKGKVFPYSLPSVGPGADPSVQAVSLQVT